MSAADFGDDLTKRVIVDGPVLHDPSTTTAPAQVEAVFFDIRQRLIKEIRRADAIVGCVAWLTDGPILAALAEVPHGVQIIVQTEDFLRPDHPSVGNVKIRERYEALPRFSGRYQLPGIVRDLNTCSAWMASVAPVRSLGDVSRSRRKAQPRSHHKFCVFMRRETMTEAICDFYGSPTDEHTYDVFIPYKVWTGSFNWTWNATRSLENAVMIESRPIAERFALEWSKAFAISERLDWSIEWDDTDDFRVGT